MDTTMISNLKTDLQNTKNILNLVDIVKEWKGLALKLKVFDVLDNPQGAMIEAIIDNLYKWKLNQNNLQDVIYARNKAVLIIKQYLDTKDTNLINELKSALVELVNAINKK
jgi:hypothetical protein